MSASPTLTGTIGGASLTLSSLTSGRVTYAGASGLLQDSANLTFDGTNLGVGTSSPDAKLDVVGPGLTAIFGSETAQNAYTGWKYNSTTLGYVGNGAGVVSGGGATDFAIGATGARALLFGTNDTERMRLDSSGNLGIGTTSPNRKLEVGGTSTAYMGFNSTSNRRYTVGSESLGFIVYDDTASAYRMVIDASGNLVIGDTSGSYRLDVKGSTGNGIAYRDGTVINYLGTTGSNLGFLGTLTNHPVAFLTNATERMRLDTSGNLGIGTSSPTAKLNIYEPTAAAARIRVLANGAQQAALQLAGNGTTFGTTSFDLFQDGGSDAYVYQRANANLIFATNNTERMRLDSSGNLGIGTTSPGSTLDVRFATNPVTDNGLGLNAIRSYVTAALAADIGGAVTFGGTSTSGGALASFGQIAGRKENATSSNYAGYLQFVTNNSTGTMAERMRLDSSGNLGIGTSSPNASAILDAQRTTKGVRMPNMTTTQKNAIASPAAGLMVFDTTLAKLCVYSGSAWQTITSV